MELVQHLYSDRVSRCYIDGRRVSREAFELAITTAMVKGKQHCCFATRCKETSKGRFHRINYSSIGAA